MTFLQAPRQFRWTVSTEVLALGLSVYFAAAFNLSLLARVRPQGLALTAAVVALLLCVHLLILLVAANRYTLKPLALVLLPATAAASFFIDRLGIYLDPSMVRNVLRTDPQEATELIGVALMTHIALWGVLPALLLTRVDVHRRRWRSALWVRLAWLAATVTVLAAVVVAAFQPIASMTRNHRELRYLITPANYIWSIGKVLHDDTRQARAGRLPIGLDAVAGPTTSTSARPMLVVLVVGETVRAANWGLNGHTRQTTPRLAQLPIVNFRDVTACGTNTEVSLPCMFAPVGRSDYDEDRIRGSESLLHVLARAGLAVHWRDNQSGCKGVCDGLPGDRLIDRNPPGLCSEGRCLDEGLLFDLDERLSTLTATNFWVLHPLGNHGPSYFRRFPPRHARFTPYCQQDDLQKCSAEEIAKAYDNAVLYTDEWLSQLIERLRQASERIDSAVIFVSDHGESLGESNLFLHGMPYAIAPDVQKKVPMVWWLSDGLMHRRGLDAACLRQRSTQPAQHDHLFHSILNLVDVRTALYDPSWDLLRACQSQRTAP